VRSGPTKILSTKAALFVLLAFQLIVGLPLQTAQAALDSAAHMAAATQGKASAGGQLVARAAIVSMPAAIGTRMMDPPTPRATAHPSTLNATSMTHADCPMHHDTAHGATGANDSDKQAHPGKQAPAGNHDCCHVSACQCQCVYTPAAFDLPPLADLATSVAIPSLSSAQFVAPRIDEFLRPPIA
jgi:hypothetical protein